MAQETKTREDMIRDFLQSERDPSATSDADMSLQKDVSDETKEGTPLLLDSGDDNVQGSEEPDEQTTVNNVLIAWEGPEFETFSHDRRWYLTVVVILLLIVTYAVIVNSPIMAITFILIGVVGYIYLQKDPRQLTFAVTYQGILVGNELYEFDQIESFWIFYEPPHTYLLSITMKSGLIPYIHIPLHQVDPIALREALLQFVPEERRELTMVDTLERLLHI
jgi:hypothetical protein